jgi:predicted Zn-dependent protease
MLFSPWNARKTAAKRFHMLSELDPGQPKAWQGLGLSYLALSSKAFQSLEKTAPESPYWFALAARSKVEQQQYRVAFHLYREALRRAPHLVLIHAGLAEIYRNTGHDDWAVSEDAKAVVGETIAARPGTPGFLLRAGYEVPGAGEGCFRAS